MVVSDIKLGDLTGVDILKKAKEVNSGIEVILMTAYATVETAVQALRLGAFDYIQNVITSYSIHYTKLYEKFSTRGYNTALLLMRVYRFPILTSRKRWNR